MLKTEARDIVRILEVDWYKAGYGDGVQGKDKAPNSNKDYELGYMTGIKDRGSKK
jgi:hypothetical protein